jgi:hypothetical protein
MSDCRCRDKMVIEIPGGGKLVYLNHCQVGFTTDVSPSLFS